MVGIVSYNVWLLAASVLRPIPMVPALRRVF